MAAGERTTLPIGPDDGADTHEVADSARFESAREQLEDIANGASERTHRYGIRSQPNGPMPKTLDDSEGK